MSTFIHAVKIQINNTFFSVVSQILTLSCWKWKKKESWVIFSYFMLLREFLHHREADAIWVGRKVGSVEGM